jgi:hypothetical protein
MVRPELELYNVDAGESSILADYAGDKISRTQNSVSSPKADAPFLSQHCEFPPATAINYQM